MIWFRTVHFCSHFGTGHGRKPTPKSMPHDLHRSAQIIGGWKRHGIGTDCRGCRGLRATLCAFVPLPWKPSLSTLPFHPIVYPFLQSHTSKFKSWQITVGRPSFRYIPNYVEPFVGVVQFAFQFAAATWKPFVGKSSSGSVYFGNPT